MSTTLIILDLYVLRLAIGLKRFRVTLYAESGRCYIGNRRKEDLKALLQLLTLVGITCCCNSTRTRSSRPLVSLYTGLVHSRTVCVRSSPYWLSIFGCAYSHLSAVGTIEGPRKRATVGVQGSFPVGPLQEEQEQEQEEEQEEEEEEKEEEEGEEEEEEEEEGGEEEEGEEEEEEGEEEQEEEEPHRSRTF